MRIEIIYMDRNKDAEEYECDYISAPGEWLYLTNVVYPFEANKLSINLNNVDYFVEYEEEGAQEAESKFKVGDYARIIAEHHGHSFNNGEIVEIRAVTGDDYGFEYEAWAGNDYWFVRDDELELVSLGY